MGDWYSNTDRPISSQSFTTPAMFIVNADVCAQQRRSMTVRPSDASHNRWFGKLFRPQATLVHHLSPRRQSLLCVTSGHGVARCQVLSRDCAHTVTE